MFCRATDGVDVWRLCLSEQELVKALASHVNTIQSPMYLCVLQKDLAGVEPEASFVSDVRCSLGLVALLLHTGRA